MGKCWGITKKLRFCRNETGEKFLCHRHAAQPKYLLIIAVTGILFSYIGTLIPNPWDNENVSDPFSQQTGTLKPKYSGTSKTSSEPYTSVGVDQNSQVYTIKMSEGSIVQPLGRYAPFSISRDKNGLLISAIVHSLDGKIIAKIINNEWVLNPNNYFRKNFYKSALEVIDEYDIPELQVEYLDESRIKIGGIFHLKEKEISEIYPDFPTTPKDTNPRAVISFRGVILIIGKDGYLTCERNTSPEELRTNARNIEPWFDYSKPQKLGIRK
jgi:hypothetical protein